MKSTPAFSGFSLDLLLHFPVLRNLRFSQYNLGLVFHTIYSCIFYPCNFARIAFSTPAFLVPPPYRRGWMAWSPAG